MICKIDCHDYVRAYGLLEGKAIWILIKYFVLKGQPFPSGGGDQNKNVKSMILSEDAKSILFIIENPTVVSND